MKRILFIFTLCFFAFSLFSQSINTKAIEKTNNINANYKTVVGTKIKLIPPRGFTESKSFTGFQHELAGSSIIVSEIPGEVNRNMIGLDKKYLIKTGVIVDKQTFYKINGFDAMLIEGKQVAYGKTYNKIMLLTGDIYRSYLISASMPSNVSQRHIEEVKESVLGVIYDPKIESQLSDRFDFSVDVSGTGLKKGNLMLSSLTYSDDGNVPSKTQEKTSMTIRKSTVTKALSEEEKIILCKRLFEAYPLEWDSKIKQDPKPFVAGNFKGYEMYAQGTHKEMFVKEFIYQTIIFVNLDYYVITGFTYGKVEDNLKIFKKVAASLKPNK
ncbi:MAG: hypothetical protein KBG30_13400 [Bacteroidales bacterium]|nr:hypothetical protein [Bacteroidales bacterium]